MNYKDAPLKTEDIVAQLSVLYQEKKRKAELPPTPLEYTFPMRLDLWLELKEWYETTKDMTEQEYIAYYESVYGAGSWAETKALGLCDMLGVCVCDEEEND